MARLRKSLLEIKKILVNLGRPILLLFKLTKKILTNASTWYVIGGIMLILTAGATYWFYKEIITQLPNVDEIKNPPLLSSKILNNKGDLLYKFYIDENRTWIPIEKVPLSLIWATVAVEDKEFFGHHGMSFRGLTQAVWHDVTKSENEKLRGGSTITQQLAKNVFLTNEKSFKRKLKELVLAVMLEWKLDKYQILERYFNQIPYGGETYGVQEAANKYFGKNVWELNMAEATFIAGLPAAPSSYLPSSNLEFAKMRQRQVIDQMVEANFITSQKAETLKNTPIVVRNDGQFIKSPHFVFYVKDKLEEMGYKNFEKSGLTITTSLNSEVQQMAEKIVKEEINNVSRLRISNGAALVIDVKTGDVLAMVGSKDYYAKDIDGKYNVTTALRQPGSSIKPINYLTALEHGWTLASWIEDAPVSYPIKGQKPYTPQNYNGRYVGWVNLRTALGSSLNIPSVKLLDSYGVNTMIDKAEKMGINSWSDRSRYGLSLALGSGEVKMTELSQAYSIFANLGEKVEINPIVEIKDYLGKTVYQKPTRKERVIDPGYAYLINSALSDDNARAPVFGLNSKLKIEGKTVAVKTGTTNSLKDNWCVGWTPTYLVATWVGNNDSSPMSWVASGVTGATPIWNKIMREMIKEKADEQWPIPPGITKSNVCGKDEYFIEGTQDKVKCMQRLTPTPEEIN